MHYSRGSERGACNARGPAASYAVRAMAEGPASSLPAPTPEVVSVLVENHRDFLRFVERRVGNRAIAEEIVQDAFVRGMGHAHEIEESVVGWFYRVLRNAVVDHQRRQASQARRLEAFATELASEQGGEELAAVACACITRLAGTLKPEYADALQAIEVRGVAVKDYAAEQGISASNAGVRVHRARAALLREVTRSCGTCAAHGCFDCRCKSAPSSA